MLWFADRWEISLLSPFCLFNSPQLMSCWCYCAFFFSTNVVGGAALVDWNANLFHSIPSLISQCSESFRAYGVKAASFPPDGSDVQFTDGNLRHLNLPCVSLLLPSPNRSFYRLEHTLVRCSNHGSARPLPLWWSAEAVQAHINARLCSGFIFVLRFLLHRAKLCSLYNLKVLVTEPNSQWDSGKRLSLLSGINYLKKQEDKKRLCVFTVWGKIADSLSEDKDIKTAKRIN